MAAIKARHEDELLATFTKKKLSLQLRQIEVNYCRVNRTNDDFHVPVFGTFYSNPCDTFERFVFKYVIKVTVIL